MAKRKKYNPITPSYIQYENTGQFLSHGRIFKVVGFNAETNQAIVKNDRGEHQEKTSLQIAKLATTP
jgi:hypothetical protein